MIALTILACAVSVILVSLAAKIFTDPIQRMIAVIRQVKQGRFDRPHGQRRFSSEARRLPAGRVAHGIEAKVRMNSTCRAGVPAGIQRFILTPDRPGPAMAAFQPSTAICRTSVQEKALTLY
jgi:hypothetical protein